MRREAISFSFSVRKDNEMSLNLNYKADVVVETENLSREDWLNYRRQGIGGSDAAAIMGVSPFCTKKYTMLIHLRFYKYIRSSSRRTLTFRLRRQVGKFPVRLV